MSARVQLLLIGALLGAGAVAAQAQVLAPGGEGFLDHRDPVIKKKQRSKIRLRARTSVGLMHLSEDQKTPVNAAGAIVPEAATASPDVVQWLDVRGFYEAAPWREDLPGVRSLGDIRLRLAGEVSRAIDRAQGTPPAAGTSRIRDSHGLGQRGGSEIDLRELYGGYSGPTSVYGGRIIVREADGLTIDGLRVLRKLGKHKDLDLGIFGGLAPDPLSRSIETDYGDGFNPAFGAGTTVGYKTRRGYGSVGLGGILPSGFDDGDTIVTGTRATRVAETLRLFLTSTAFFRLQKVDLYHYAVFDALSDSGAALRALHAQVGYRPSIRFHAEAGYSHMSSIALEVYLFDLLNEPIANTVQSNLLVQRTARDEVRGQIDFTFGERRFDLYSIARGRRRALDAPAADPSFKAVDPQYALDLTVGARDRRSFKKLRLGASVSAIYDFRATSTVVHVDVGRDFMKERLAVDASFDFQRTVDDTPANAAVACGINAFTSCFGRYSGNVYDLGATGVYMHSKHWMALADLHLIYDGGASDASVRTANTAQSPILTQVVFLKGQYTF